MEAKLIMGPGLVHSLFKALKTGGAVDWHVEQFTDPKLMAGILQVVNGTAIITEGHPRINCREYSDVLDIWNHEEQEDLLWDKDKMAASFFQTEDLKNGREDFQWSVLEGAKEKGLRPLNACPLRFLMKNTWLIPNSWKDFRVHFPMTTLGRSENQTYHRFLSYTGYWREDWVLHTTHRYREKDVVAVRPS